VLYDSASPFPPRNFGADNLMERCRSGRSGRSRKPLCAQAYRGFESHPLRRYQGVTALFTGRPKAGSGRFANILQTNAGKLGRFRASFVRQNRAQCGIDTTCRIILHPGQNVRVNIQGEANRGMA
jgi:hypothetical protein